MSKTRSPRHFLEHLFSAMEKSITRINIKLRKTSIGDVLVIAVFAGNLAMVASAYAVNHYYNFDAISSLGYVSNDGWCDTKITGIGAHCFGDYSLLPHFIVEENPWNLNLFGPWNYPAASMLPAYLFFGVGVFFKSQFVGLVSYLVAMAIAISIPGIWAVRNVKATLAVPVAAVFGCFSVPAIMALDRGNSVGFAVPFFLWFLVSLGRDKYWQASASILILTIIKPQFALLVLVFLYYRKFKEFFASVFGIICVSIAAFAIWPRDFPGTIVQAFQNTIAYTTGVSMTSVWPSNSSLTKGIYWLEHIARTFLGKDVNNSWSNTHQGLAAGLVAVCLLLLVFVVRKNIGIVGAAIVMIVIASLITPISWSYYLIFAIPVSAVIIRDPRRVDIQTGMFQGIFDRPGAGRLAKIAQLFIVFALALTLTRLLFPVIIPNTGANVVFTTAEIVPSVWLVALSCYLLTNIRFSKQLNLRINN